MHFTLAAFFIVTGLTRAYT